MSAVLEHSLTPTGFDEMTVKVTTLDGDEVDMFEAIDRLEVLVGQVIDGVAELAMALDDARNGNATGGNGN